MIPNPPVTLADRMAAIGGSAILALAIFGIGLLVHHAVSRNCIAKRIQGRPVVWWVAIMMFVGSCVGAAMADNQRYYLHEVVGGMGAFGLLAGLLIGNLHGLLDLYWSRLSKPVTLPTSLDGSTKTSLDQAVPSAAPETSNPYEPPRSDQARPKSMRRLYGASTIYILFVLAGVALMVQGLTKVLETTSFLGILVDVRGNRIPVEGYPQLLCGTLLAITFSAFTLLSIRHILQRRDDEMILQLLNANLAREIDRATDV